MKWTRRQSSARSRRPVSRCNEKVLFLPPVFCAFVTRLQSRWTYPRFAAHSSDGASSARRASVTYYRFNRSIFLIQVVRPFLSPYTIHHQTRSMWWSTEKFIDWLSVSRFLVTISQSRNKIKSRNLAEKNKKNLGAPTLPIENIRALTSRALTIQPYVLLLRHIWPSAWPCYCDKLFYSRAKKQALLHLTCACWNLYCTVPRDWNAIERFIRCVHNLPR